MAWLTVDYDGTEVVWERRPHRENGSWEYDRKNPCCFVELPKGSVVKLTGYTMSYDDDPLEI